MSDKNQNPTITPVADITSLMDFIQRATKEKSKIDAVLELTNPEHLEFLTEWPTTNYTKMATKLMTWRQTITELGNLDDGQRFENGRFVYHPEFDETDTLIKEMVAQFMLKMTSHKRRRSQEIVTALKDDLHSPIYNMENKMKRSLFGGLSR